MASSSACLTSCSNTNLIAGQPDNARDDVPYASIIPNLNLDGSNQAPGFVFRPADTCDFIGQYVYDADLSGLHGSVGPAALKSCATSFTRSSPNWRLKVHWMPARETLDDLFPGLTTIFLARRSIARRRWRILIHSRSRFQFPITAAATVMTRDEFIAFQTDNALLLRQEILLDPERTGVVDHSCRQRAGRGLMHSSPHLKNQACSDQMAKRRRSASAGFGQQSRFDIVDGHPHGPGGRSSRDERQLD